MNTMTASFAGRRPKQEALSLPRGAEEAASAAEQLVL
jgi:hypothetical protein